MAVHLKRNRRVDAFDGRPGVGVPLANRSALSLSRRAVVGRPRLTIQPRNRLVVCGRVEEVVVAGVDARVARGAENAEHGRAAVLERA